MKTIYFMPNGISAVFIDTKQVPNLQESWIQLFFKHLLENGYDPLDFDIVMPDGKKAKAFKTEDGYNWKIKSPQEYKP